MCEIRLLPAALPLHKNTCQTGEVDNAATPARLPSIDMRTFAIAITIISIRGFIIESRIFCMD